jgi:NADH:ubiquinone oxidoreductase subunit 6 (subunit J)
VNPHDVLFWVFGGATALGAVAVVLSQNVARMAFWLIVSLGSTAGLFFLLNADFIAAAQLLVYVGGTLVLLIFGVMLTASGPLSVIKTSPGESVIGALLGVCLLGVLGFSVCSTGWETLPSNQPGSTPAKLPAPPLSAVEGNSIRPIGFSLLGLRPDRDMASGDGVPSTGYLLPFEIISVHLLVVLIAAAYLARAKRRQDSGDAPTAA